MNSEVKKMGYQQIFELENKRRTRGIINLVDRNQPCVIMVPGYKMGMNTQISNEFVGKLENIGINSMRYTPTCHYPGLVGLNEYRQVINYGSKEFGQSPLGASGESAGGVYVLAESRNRSLSAIAVTNTPFYVPNINSWLLWIIMKAYDVFFGEYYRHQISKGTIPLGVFQGSNDRLVPSHSSKIYNLYPGPKKLSIIDGANHNFTNAKHRGELIQREVEFFQEHLMVA